MATTNLPIYNIVARLNDGREAHINKTILETICDLQNDEPISNPFQMLFSGLTELNNLVLHELDALDVSAASRIMMLQTIDDVQTLLVRLHTDIVSGRTAVVEMDGSKAPGVFDEYEDGDGPDIQTGEPEEPETGETEPGEAQDRDTCQG